MRTELIIKGNAVYEIDLDCIMANSNQRGIDKEEDMGKGEKEKEDKPGEPAALCYPLRTLPERD